MRIVIADDEIFWYLYTAHEMLNIPPQWNGALP